MSNKDVLSNPTNENELVEKLSVAELEEDNQDGMGTVIAQFMELVHGMSSDAGEKRKLQIEYEHERKKEELKIQNEAHKRNIIFSGFSLVILGAVIITSLVMGEAETAKDFLYIILSAIGGAGLVQFFGKK